jgi:hypothetical protein
MASASEIRSRINADGSIDVWAKGWRIRFEKASKPEIFAEKTAPADTVGGGSGIESRAEEDGIWLWSDKWYVLIRDGQPQVMPAKPTTSDAHNYTFRLYRRRVE